MTTFSYFSYRMTPVELSHNFRTGKSGMYGNQKATTPDMPTSDKFTSYTPFDNV